jgi:hypothetical protein
VILANGKQVKLKKEKAAANEKEERRKLKNITKVVGTKQR